MRNLKTRVQVRSREAWSLSSLVSLLLKFPLAVLSIQLVFRTVQSLELAAWAALWRCEKTISSWRHTYYRALRWKTRCWQYLIDPDEVFLPGLCFPISFFQELQALGHLLEERFCPHSESIHTHHSGRKTISFCQAESKPI